MMTKAVFFDIDDTLVDTSSFADLARHAAIESMCNNGLPLEPDEAYDLLKDIIKRIVMLIGLLVLILIINACLPLLGSLGKLIGKALNFVFDAIIWIISAPFKLLGFLFNPKSNRKRR